MVAAVGVVWVTDVVSPVLSNEAHTALFQQPEHPQDTVRSVSHCVLQLLRVTLPSACLRV